ITYQDENDFHLYFNSGSGKVTAEVIFVGFGISEPQKGWDDYAGIDVAGKIVLIYRGTPSDGQDWSAENERDYKMQQAAKHEAAALLMFERDWAIRGGTIHEDGYFPQLPALSVSKKVALDIFRGTYRQLDHVIRDLAKKPGSFATGKIMSIEAQVDKIEPGVGENVIGILLGNDPILKDEFIVIGAHMDHNGLGTSGFGYFGADDNASGTATVMELARVFASRKSDLRRSLVFIAFGGEEQGLRGSKFFATNPTVPVEKICLMINFDMVGQGNGGAGFGGRNYFPGIVSEMIGALSDSIQKKFSAGRAGGMWGSDHAHFIEQGIPDFTFYSTGDHPFYHQFEDDPSQINPQSLQFVGDRVTELLLRFGNHPSSLLFDGNRQGRTFLMFGDQLDFALTRDQQFREEHELKQWLKEQIDAGFSGVVLPLDGPLFSQPENCYRSIDEMNQWVKNNSHLALRYQNGNSLHQARSEGKIAIATGVVGSQIFQRDLGALRNLPKLGLTFLVLNDRSDMMFEGSKLSAFGEEVLRICQAENIAIFWQIEHHELLQKLLRNFSGKVIVQKRPPLSPLMIEEVKALAQQKNALLWIECQSDVQPHQLSELMDVIASEKLHFSIQVNSQNADTDWPMRLVQALYENRMQRHSRNAVYKEMVKVLGENLRNFLK
ncbi:MAG: M28 family peptidase, partial [candidate division KSB1 bacterium]|nr:M28 family peptidase [candidate division KSB1 bacterium]